MRIMGIDPGSAILGWAIIEKESYTMRLIACDAITTDSKESEERRLFILYETFSELITFYTPDVVSVEQVYFAANAKTAITVAQARGVILLACAQQNISVSSYSPLQVKKTITGDGNADKRQIQYMIAKLLQTNDSLPKLDDITDAIAIALTHGYMKTFI